jgi:hypothetical protein
MRECTPKKSAGGRHTRARDHAPDTAGLSAACWTVPENRPTTLVSIMDSKGEHSHTPIAGTANFRMRETVGA